METQKQYEARERFEFVKQSGAVNKAPLADRREAQTEFRYALTNPELIGERVHWLIMGNCGYGSYIVTREVLLNPRINREAWLCRTIAVLEWQCPQDRASDEFMALSPEDQERVTAQIKSAILFWEEEQKTEAEYRKTAQAEAQVSA